jgi:Family of unknown function (DUF5880)
MSTEEDGKAAGWSPPAAADAESDEDDEVKVTNSNDNDDEDEEEEEEEDEEDAGDEEDDEEEDDDDDVALRGEDIAHALRSKGPVVIKCVLLKHLRSDGKDGKPHPASPHADGTHHRVVLVEDIEEVEVDVTPERTRIQELLGGPFTFLGQYEDEGTVVIARRDLPDNVADLSVKQLRELCRDHYLDTSGGLEKSDLVDALWATQLPYNPHQLQPPLDRVRVRGDILLMRVAKTDEALDDDDDDDDDKNEDGTDGGQVEKKAKKRSAHQKLRVLPNDEFFLDYTKEEYVDFASRTDVRAPEPAEDDEEDDEEEDDEEDEDDDDDDDYDPSMEDEEEKQAMLNLVMGEVLRKFREEHGRGPDTRELLEIRSHVASQLDVEVATLEALEESAAAAAAASAKKRKKGKTGGGGGAGEADGEGGDDDGDDGKPSKHVKFQASLKNDESDDDKDGEENESKPKADNAKSPSKEGNGEALPSSD